MSNLIWQHSAKPVYIAVSKHGYGVDQIPAMAIRLAQTEVPASARPSQLLLYESAAFVEPIGFKAGAPQWPNGTKPRLVGLTTTHRGYRQTPR
jgi:hypothetical protein